jgi:hypothetical protein
MMSKQINRRLPLLLAVCLLAVSILLSVPSSASPQRAGVRTGAARNAAIISATDAVLKETSDLRELSILKDVKSGAQSACGN